MCVQLSLSYVDLKRCIIDLGKIFCSGSIAGVTLKHSRSAEHSEWLITTLKIFAQFWRSSRRPRRKWRYLLCRKIFPCWLKSRRGYLLFSTHSLVAEWISSMRMRFLSKESSKVCRCNNGNSNQGHSSYFSWFEKCKSRLSKSITPYI